MTQNTTPPTPADFCTREELRFRETLYRELAKGKTKGLRPGESVLVWLAGRVDGMSGCIREIQPGSWASARLQKEAHAYQEYCARALGRQQIELRRIHARCSSLVDEILALDEQIRQAEANVPSEEPSSPQERKSGEEALTDAQVRARRKREAARAATRSRGVVETLTRQRDERKRELSVLHHFVEEADAAMRLICRCVMDHVNQRIDAYWRAALRAHPQAERLPPAPAPMRLPEAGALAARARSAPVAELLNQARAASVPPAGP